MWSEKLKLSKLYYFMFHLGSHSGSLLFGHSMMMTTMKMVWVRRRRLLLPPVRPKQEEEWQVAVALVWPGLADWVDRGLEQWLLCPSKAKGKCNRALAKANFHALALQSPR